MNNSYRRKKDPINNKRLILETAAQIGANNSWTDVTFQAIADRTGLSKGGIIHHFPTKENLLNEIFDESLKELSTLLKNEIADNPEITMPYAYLKIVCSDLNDQHYINTMRVIMKGTVNDGHFRDKWKKWVTENILINFESAENTDSIICLLLADGLWFSDVVGIYPIGRSTKNEILTTVQNIKL